MELYFYNKYIIRFMSFQKYFFLNLKRLHFIQMEKIKFFFRLHFIQNLLDLSFSNYFFLFKFIFGGKSFVSKIKINFDRGVYYYSFLIYTYFHKYQLFFILLYLNNDILNTINRINYEWTWNFLNPTLKIHDINFFLERKNTPGFFNLKDNLHISFSLIGFRNKEINRNFFSLFKY